MNQDQILCFMIRLQLHIRKLLVPLAIGLFGSLSIAMAEGDSAATEAERKSLEIFEKQVRPALLEHCIRCHGAEKQRGGLRLDSAEGWAVGGDSGPALVPHDTTSLLLQAIRYQDPIVEMPPKGKLPSRVIEAFEAWVALGAVDPRREVAPRNDASDAVPDIDEGREFWAFQPLAPVAVPESDSGEWPETPIDRFIFAGLERNGLAPNPPADRGTLLRRVYYDLVGLPPTPREIREFLADRSDKALEKVVDRLLSSPRFGQRWGRHWLDVVRFAESSGGGRTLLFPDAWRFRDYVIESFNRDLPYNRFLKEQIAGDLLPWDNWQQRQRQLVATGFLLLGPTNYEMQDKGILEMDVVDEQLDTIGKAFLGMTIGCARCHDHKFDPIPTSDYYAMAGIFKSTKSLIHSNVSSWNKVGLPLPDDQESRLAAHQRAVAAVKRALKKATERWEQAGGDAKPGRGDRKSLDPKQIGAVVIDDDDAQRIGAWKESVAIAQFVGSRYLHDESAGKGEKQVVYHHRFDSPGEYEIFVSYSAGSNRSTRVPIRVFHRGGETLIRVDQRKRPKVDGAFVSLGTFNFDSENPLKLIVSNEDTDDGVVIADAVAIAESSSSISTLIRQTDDETEKGAADDTADAEQLRGLEARVKELTRELQQLEKSGPMRPVAMAVQDDPDGGDIHLMIRGVVGQHGPLTPRGVMQVAAWEPFPSIPEGSSGRLEYADWIADERHPLTARVMVNRIWHWMMGRGIVRTVDNFGSTGEPPSDPALLDYLAGEFIRDGWSVKKLIRRIALSRVYQLSSAPGEQAAIDGANRGMWRMNRKRLRAEDIRDSILAVSGSLDHRYAGPAIKSGTKIEYGYEFDSRRRSVYLPVFRNTLPEVFEVFDFADPNIQLGARSTSTIAAQALWLMNHPDMLRATRKAASRLLATSHESDLERIEYAFLQVLGRPPTAVERRISFNLLLGEATTEAPQVSPTENWAMLYQALFQSIDFRYLN